MKNPDPGDLHQQRLGIERRRRQGSYYTPSALVERLLDEALDPLIARTIAGKTPAEAERALRSLRICDPACGSGRFLVAAASRCSRSAGFLRLPPSAGTGPHPAGVSCGSPFGGTGPGPNMLAFGSAAEARPGAVPEGRKKGVQPPDPEGRKKGAQPPPGCLYGVDIDAEAVGLCQKALRAVGHDASRVRVGDALLGGPSSLIGAPPRVLRAEQALRAKIPFFDWTEQYPEVFAEGGFDLVVGNPPFLNAIEGRSARSAAFSAYARHAYAPFAEGAYDLSLLFWARTLLHLLRPGGIYALLLPANLLSQSRPWQRWVHERWRPFSMQLYPIDRFADAQVRVVALIGQAGASPRLRLRVEEDDGTVRQREGPWPEVHTWYEAAVAEPVSAPSVDATVPLEHAVTISAGCVAAAAYQLAPLVDDHPDADGPWLVTTGAIDRYACRWGQAPIRYLGRDFTHPRWPTAPGTPPSVARARDAQRAPKVLVAGLTAVVEAWADLDGIAAGTVATWCLRPASPLAEADLASWLRALAVVLNSATFSRIYMQRHGANALSGRQTTIKKSALARMPLPACFASPAAPDAAGPLPSLAALHDSIAASTGPERQRHDARAHQAVAALYGRTAEQADDDYRWWCRRAKTSPHR